MRKSKGYRAQTRKLFSKPPRKKGISPLGPLLHDYVEGENVSISIDPSVHKGMPHRRFQGKIGTILEKRGRAYVVTINDGGLVKKVITLPDHIKPYKSTT
jgi:large subunit ribosomal protein L21e